MKPPIRESLRYAKLIGESNEPPQLKKVLGLAAVHMD